MLYSIVVFVGVEDTEISGGEGTPTVQTEPATHVTGGD